MSDKLGSMCRSCLATEVELLPLNAVVEESGIPSIQIDECLQMHMNVKITQDDGLPYNICMKCMDKIVDFRKFYLNYMRSEALLLQLLLSVTSNHLESDRTEAGNVEVFPVKTEDSGNDNENGDFMEETNFSEEFLDQEMDKWESDEEMSSEEEESQTNVKIEPTIETSGDTQINKTNVKRAILIYCLQCHKIFPTSNALRQHFTKVHGEDNARGYCNHCKKTFPSKLELMTHLHIHKHIEKVVKCPYCEKRFANKNRLKPHVLVHTGERPYSCKECGRPFRQKAALRTHMLLHTGKMIECSKCDKKFSRKAYLDIHMRTHDDVRPYACHICDKKYRIKCHLTSHLLSHSKVLTFNCHICGKLFKDKSSLNTHLDTHIRPYRCPRCPLKASKLYLFRRHLVNMHGIQDDPKLFMNKCH